MRGRTKAKQAGPHRYRETSRGSGANAIGTLVGIATVVSWCLLDPTRFSGPSVAAAAAPLALGALSAWPPTSQGRSNALRLGVAAALAAQAILHLSAAVSQCARADGDASSLGWHLVLGLLCLGLIRAHERTIAALVLDRMLPKQVVVDRRPIEAARTGTWSSMALRSSAIGDLGHGRGPPLRLRHVPQPTT